MDGIKMEKWHWQQIYQWWLAMQDDTERKRLQLARQQTEDNPQQPSQGTDNARPGRAQMGRAQMGRAARACLSRCENLQDVCFEPAYHDLLQRLQQPIPSKADAGATDGAADGAADAEPAPKLSMRQTEALCLVAGVLAQVRTDTGNHGGQARAAGLLLAEAGYSQTRFTAMLRENDPQRFYRALLRAIQFNKRQADVLQLAQDLHHAFFEIQDRKPERWAKGVLMRWARDYYQNLPADNSSSRSQT